MKKSIIIILFSLIFSAYSFGGNPQRDTEFADNITELLLLGNTPLGAVKFEKLKEKSLKNQRPKHIPPLRHIKPDGTVLGGKSCLPSDVHLLIIQLQKDLVSFNHHLKRLKYKTKTNTRVLEQTLNNMYKGVGNLGINSVRSDCKKDTTKANPRECIGSEGSWVGMCYFPKKN